MSKRIEPRILKGFRDTLPDVGLCRDALTAAFKEVFLSFGFSPIDTPALEYAEILLGKGSEETDKQTYRFEDNGGRDVALRFDLTVPLARFAAMHSDKLGVPFRRYHIAPVWRAEKPQRGRYREFIQCDFDIIGSRSVTSDTEVLALVSSALSCVDIAHTIRINNRKVLNGALQHLGLSSKSQSVLRVLDKLDKQGEASVRSELSSLDVEEQHIDKLFALLQVSKDATSAPVLFENAKQLFPNAELYSQGLDELAQVVKGLEAYGLDETKVKIDFGIARGLDYYTGTVFETTHNDLPDIGSIASGGRYDDLASLYTKKELPGVGGSIGLDRLLAALEELGKIEKRFSSADVLVTVLEQEHLPDYIRLSNQLRKAGIAVELFTESSKLGNQLKYASKKGIPLAILAGATELSSSTCSIKDLRDGTQHDSVPIASLESKVRQIL